MPRPRYTYNAPNTGTAHFEAPYATGGQCMITISINGEAPTQLTCESTDGANAFATQAAEIPLKAGINIFVVGGTDQGRALDLNTRPYPLNQPS